MKLIRDLLQQQLHSVITIGNFDGMHLGHQRLIETLIADSRHLQLPSALITFEPHPTELFLPASPAPRLMRFSEKWNAINKYGVDYFYSMRFNAPLAALSAEDFVEKILVNQLGVKKIIIGDNFRFGAKRLGDVQLLQILGKKFDFEVEAISQLLYRGDRISSSRMRDAVHEGDFKMAYALTHRPFCLTGKVSYGDQIGRTLGFPTANIHLQQKRVPLMGIFVTQVHGLVDHPLPGVASVGYRPTFDGKKILLEVFLFDFDKMIYGQRITVEFLEKIRDELRFDSVDELVAQIQKDVDYAKSKF